MHDADTKIIYFNPEAIIHKNLKPITKKQVYDAFNHKDLLVFTNSKELEHHLRSLNWNNQNLLMMTSGNFNEINLNNLIK